LQAEQGWLAGWSFADPWWLESEVSEWIAERVKIARDGSLQLA